MTKNPRSYWVDLMASLHGKVGILVISPRYKFSMFSEVNYLNS